MSRSHTQTNRIDIPDYQPAKRRRVTGLNSRFDRMIKSVDDMFSYRNSSPASSRKRIQSVSTSSVSSHDLPKTPVDAYNNIHLAGKLGNDFSLLKMKKSHPLLREDSDGCPNHAASPREPRDSLPDWLAHTFCSLEAGHPLRGLLSPSRLNSKSNSPPVEFPGVSHEEQLFAFSPFEIDKQEQVPDAAYRADSALNIKSVSSVVPARRILLNSRLGAPADVIPFSTPGCFASVHRPIPDGKFQKPLVPNQVTSLATNMMHPPALPPPHLRLDDAIERPQNPGTFSNLVQYGDPPSDFQEHDAYNDHISHMPGGDDRLNVYATPGPTFACSRPVYFDSPTEDPSLSDPLHPESYELDLNTIDFRWRPFLQSNLQERETNRQTASSSSPLGYAVPNPAGNQGRWNARFAVDRAEYGASSEELPSLAKNMDVAYLGDTGAIQPSNVNTTRSSAITNPIGPSLINDVLSPVSALASDDLLSPLRDQPEAAFLASDDIQYRDNIYTSEVVSLQRGDETRPVRSEAHEIRPSTPIRQLKRQLPASPPSTPQKTRSSRLCGIPQAPVRKTSSALSWMVPLKFSNRTTVTYDNANLDSHDTIESWSETS